MNTTPNRRKTDKPAQPMLVSRKALSLVLGVTAAAAIGAGLLTALFFLEADTSTFRLAVLAAIVVAILIAAPLLTALHFRGRGLARLCQQVNQTTSTDRLTSCIDGVAFPHLVNINQEGRGALLVVDADHLRRINDRFGHRWGDEALRVIAEAVRGSVRAGDLVGRVGGEEFGVFLRGATLEEARDVAKRLQAVIDRTIFEPGGERCQLSVTVGGVVFDDQVEFDHLMRAAVLRLDNAKKKGEGAADVALIALNGKDDAPRTPPAS